MVLTFICNYFGSAQSKPKLQREFPVCVPVNFPQNHIKFVFRWTDDSTSCLIYFKSRLYRLHNKKPFSVAIIFGPKIITLL